MCAHRCVWGNVGLPWVLVNTSHLRLSSSHFGEVGIVTPGLQTGLQGCALFPTGGDCRGHQGRWTNS